jgi:hypothetical protein
MYLYDNIAGSAVDIQSTFPFSDWELRGLEEKELLVFNTALERLNLRELLPQLSVSYLTDGFYAGSLVYDPRTKNFMDILTHDALQCSVTPSPFNNIDPSVKVSVSGPTSQFLANQNEYTQQYLNSMPPQFVDLLKAGAFVLDPVTTLFVARRGLTDRAYQSYLHRILPMYLIEKSMFRGTLVESNRRQRDMTHIAAGDDVWTPTGEDLLTLVEQFQDAERDPLGGWISTRNAVQVSDLRPGGDFWKWTDMTDVMTNYKLRALGISEALLSGDASYAAAESAYSTFLETVNGYRTHLTNNIFQKKIFPLIAVANDLYKNHGKKNTTNRPVDFLFNTGNRQNLNMPILHWHKDLAAKAEDNMMDMLEKVSGKGVPVPMKMWLAAAGIDKDTLVRDHREDDDLKKALGMDKQPPEDVEDEDGEYTDASLTTLSSKAGHRNRLSILSRDFGDEIIATTRTGKPKYVHNLKAKQKDINHKIAKIAANAASDQNYRAQLARSNSEKLGTTTLKGF